MVIMGNRTNAVTEIVERQAIPQTGYLAGYPRSGIALTRTVLSTFFGHKSTSMYQEDDLGADYADFIGHVSPEQQVGILAEMAEKQGLLFVKTHNRPSAPFAFPCIIAVRDGRRTLASLRAFYRQRHGLNYSWDAMIRGHHPWGNWSDWVRSWVLCAPPNALWLRYGETVTDPKAAAQKIAARFGFQVVPGVAMPHFADMQKCDPTIFRKAATDGNGGMPPEAEKLFWELHGSTQSLLGCEMEAGAR